MLHSMNDRDCFLQSELSRRTMLKYSIAGLVGLAFGSQILQTRQSVGALQAPANPRMDAPIPPLFCIAYIDPGIPSQANQESIIARYPLAIVPQDMRANRVQWKDRIKHLNPNILMLGYQMVIEETTVPGPGHDVMRLVQNSWCMYPGGFYPTVQVEPGPRNFRIYDPRQLEWQESFLAACRAMLESYPYNGIFLDQCTVYEKAALLPAVKAEMRQALQVTLLRLRREFPSLFLIGNSSYNWQGLNGELNEGRSEKMGVELAPFVGHALPTMDLYQSLLTNPNDIETVKREMALAHSKGAFYSAAVDYQHVLWFDAFDEIMAKYK
jgi:hypothetical protein